VSSLIDDDPEPLARYPGQDHRDYTAAMVKIGVSAVPMLGGPASELFGTLVAPILGRRRDAWFEELRLRVNDLIRKVDRLTFESLSQNEEFVSATLQATSVALRTHASEKLQALQNAVLNVAAGTGPDGDLQSIFLSLVDSLTPLHLRLLALFKRQTPVRIADAPEWLRADECSQAAKELLDRELIGGPSHLVPNRDLLILGENGTYTFTVGALGSGRSSCPS